MTKRNTQARNVARGKHFERQIVKELKQFGAYRIWRMGNYAESRPDIKFNHVKFKNINIDCKKLARMKHHYLWNEANRKYGGIPMLVTEQKGESDRLVIMHLDFLKELLNYYDPL
jgi:Holliday junction resolvase